MIWASGTWVGANDHTDPNQQFAFVEYDGQLYLYSVGGDKFVSWNNDGAHLMDIPEYYVTAKCSPALRGAPRSGEGLNRGALSLFD